MRVVLICVRLSVLSRLEAFLPAMANENKKLDEAVAAGQGAKHCIEADGSDDEAEAESNDDEPKTEKPPVIEMVRNESVRWLHSDCVLTSCASLQNFALGMMEDEQHSDADSSDSDAEDKKSDIVLSDQSKTSFSMATSRPSSKPRPVIQELN